MKAAVVSISVFLFLPSTSLAREKFEPADGKILVFVGQDVDAVEDYLKTIGVPPAGYMGYTSVQEAEGLDSPFDGGGGLQHADRILKGRPHAAFQLGLYMAHVLEGVVAGDHDAAIDRLGEWISSTGRPVFLRVGYEFDLPENAYEPEAYKNAYRYVVDRLRKRGVTNAAFVWHSCACASQKPDELMAWYPGDGHVDWYGVSYFAQFPKRIERVASVAREIGKPLMLAEASPWNARTEAAKTAWLRRMFTFANEQNAKAISYINWNWDEIPAFSSQNWGNARIQDFPSMRGFWNEETAHDRYLKAGPRLTDALNSR